MVDGVAHQVDDRREDPLGDGLVQLGVARRQHQADIFAGRPTEAAHEERDPLQQLGDRDHPGAHDRRAADRAAGARSRRRRGTARGRRRRRRASLASVRARRNCVTTSADSRSSASSRRATSTRTTPRRCCSSPLSPSSARLSSIATARRRPPAAPASAPRPRRPAPGRGRSASVSASSSRAKARPGGASAVAATDCGTTLTTAATVAAFSRMVVMVTPAAACSTLGTKRSTNARRPAASPCVSSTRSAGASLFQSSGASDVAPSRGSAGVVSWRSPFSASSSLAEAGATGCPLPSAWTRVSMARTAFSSSSTASAGRRAAAASASRRTDSMAWARSTIGSTPTMAASPLTVWNDRKSSRIWRGVGWFCAAAASTASRFALADVRCSSVSAMKPAMKSAGSNPSLTPGSLDARPSASGPRPGAGRGRRAWSGTGSRPAARARARESSSPRVVTTRMGSARSLSCARMNSMTS